MTRYDDVYLSPHYDDAALSCGGLIHQQGETGRSVLVITVFGGCSKPGLPFSPLADRLHRSMGAPEDIIVTRQQEDRAAMNILGADYRWLDFPSSTYRGQPQNNEWFYLSLPDLYHNIHPADLALVPNIAEKVITSWGTESPTIIYAPLGIGNHVDHQLTHQVGALLSEQGVRVVFYEEYPYADETYNFSFLDGNPYSLKAAEAVMERLSYKPTSIALSLANMRAHVSAIWTYQSQLAGYSEDKVFTHVKNFLTRNTPRQPMERIWKPVGSRAVTKCTI